MTFPDQERFLGAIRRALGHAPDHARDGRRLFPETPSEEESRILKAHYRRSTAEREVLLARLMEASRAVHLCVVPVPDLSAAAAAIAELAREKNPEWGTEKHITTWRHPMVGALDLNALMDPATIRIHPIKPLDPAADPSRDRREREAFRNTLSASYIGITSADFCMADTATLVLRSRNGQPRAVALVPSIHIAVIGIDQLVSDMKELFALLRWDERFCSEGLSNYMSFISGPSKTADIEATMVHGAHGPREVHLYVISPKPPAVHSPGQTST